MAKSNHILHHLCCDNGELSSYWMSYTDLIETVILGLLCGSQEGNWNMHLKVAYDKANYARYLTVFYAKILALPKSKLKVYQAFNDGQFSVQVSCLNNSLDKYQLIKQLRWPWTKILRLQGVPLDLVWSQVLFRDSNMTAEYRSAFVAQIGNTVDGYKTKLQHPDLQQTRIQKDTKTVAIVRELV